MDDSTKLAYVLQLQELGLDNPAEVKKEEDAGPSIMSVVEDNLLAHKLWQVELEQQRNEAYSQYLARQDYTGMSSTTLEAKTNELGAKVSQAMSSGASASTSRFTCAVCYDELEQSPDQSHTLPCQHTFCLRCVRRHAIECVNLGQADVQCLLPDCKTLIGLEETSNILAGCGTVFLQFHKIILERQLGNSKLYCSNLKCSEVFALEAGQNEQDGPERDVLCPFCRQLTCIKCKKEGHKGECPKTESELDKMFEDLRGQKVWAKCPACSYTIEKLPDTCNLMRCRCGNDFCYRCGKSLTRSRNRRYWGHQTCRCGLW